MNLTQFVVIELIFLALAFFGVLKVATDILKDAKSGKEKNVEVKIGIIASLVVVLVIIVFFISNFPKLAGLW